MDIGFFVKGLIIGFIVAVPVGPIGLLCINRVLSGRPAYGLSSGLGVATADAICAGIAVLGLTLLSDFLVGQQAWLHPIGGLFLCYLGFKTFLIRPSGLAISSKETGLVGAYASTFFLTLTNPVTILSFIAIYAGWGVESLSGNYLTAAILTAGVFVGSALWWFILCSGLLLFPGSFGHPELRWVHRISGVIIAGFGFTVLLGF
ncbi:MAG: LysE family translocator [Candidatus Binatia bacterium]